MDDQLLEKLRMWMQEVTMVLLSNPTVGMHHKTDLAKAMTDFDTASLQAEQKQLKSKLSNQQQKET